jgi:2,3,4,5-tetrahydropyridine-2-carboxylate N-succinyltransferase
MPPSFVNIGAYIGPDTVIDSHVSVGVAAQIGARVRITAGTQIGGLIEPLGQLPVVIGDDVQLGGQCGVYDGVSLGAGAVLCAGTIVTRQSMIYDPKRKEVYRASASCPLMIPPMAIIGTGARFLNKGEGIKSGLMVQVLIIAGWRNEIDPRQLLWEDLME